MTKVILDESLKAKLNGLNEHLELCDEAGQTVGHFLTDEEYRELLLEWADSQITPEELERRRREPRGRTLAEIWQRLGQA
jgi:hypothetical protein